jgi:hypothetical protein
MYEIVSATMLCGSNIQKAFHAFHTRAIAQQAIPSQ